MITTPRRTSCAVVRRVDPPRRFIMHQKTPKPPNHPTPPTNEKRPASSGLKADQRVSRLIGSKAEQAVPSREETAAVAFATRGHDADIAKLQGERFKALKANDLPTADKIRRNIEAQAPVRELIVKRVKASLLPPPKASPPPPQKALAPSPKAKDSPPPEEQQEELFNPFFYTTDENLVLGGMMFSADFRKACNSLTSWHFSPANLPIFDAIKHLASLGAVITHEVVSDQLRRKGKLLNYGTDDILANAHIFKIFELGIEHQAAAKGTHITRLKEAYGIRRGREIADELKKAVEDGEEFFTAFAEATFKREELEAYQAGINDAQGLPKFINADDFIATDIPAPDELVKGILHRGSKMVLGGASKSCKTWTLLDLAISVSTGADWLGFPTTKGKVLYLNLEIQDRFMQGRVVSVREAKGIAKTPDLYLWNLRGKAADICQLAPAIIAAAKSRDFALIVIDPIYKVMGDRIENSAEGIASLVNELERIAVKGDAAIVFGSHFSKGNQAGKDSMDRIGGSGVFARDPDAILTFTAHEEPGAFSVDATLRNFAPVDPFVVRWAFPLMGRADDMDAKRLKKPKTGRESIYSMKDVLEVMGNGEWTRTDLFKEVEENTGMSKPTFDNLRRAAEKAGLLAKSKLTGLWSKV